MDRGAEEKVAHGQAKADEPLNGHARVVWEMMMMMMRGIFVVT